MFFRSSLVAVLACVSSVQSAPTVATPPLPLVANAPTIAAGLKTMALFDFNNKTTACGVKGGSILLATVDSFPIRTNLSISGAISFIEPCGLNILPRADEFLTVVEGILDTGFVQENGFTTAITTQLGQYQATVLRVGIIHYQQNSTCAPAVFVDALNSEDPERSDIATNYWTLPADVVDAARGFPWTIKGGNIDA
ncbi:hypothetical protein C8R44DRAFT_881920 [Mycena epipterygia]|nr:hypothetical protein C8R44DRAFT_881920 [Mycena epipterygia]